MSEQNDLFKALCGMIDHHEDVRESYVRAPFGWAGGKDNSLQFILPHLPYRNTFVEHCGGSGIVTLNRSRCALDVFNDRDSGVAAFYLCISNPAKFKALVERLRNTIHSREIFIKYRQSWNQETDDVERAAQWYYVTRLSFNQQRRNFGRGIRGKAQQPQMISRSLRHFPKIHDVFSHVQVENLDLFQCIEDYDDGGTVHYIDPNYVGVSPGVYAHEIKEEEQWRLCRKIMNGKGFFAISGYANPIYDSPEFEWDERHEWQVTVTAQAQAFQKTNNKSGLQDQLKRDKATEVLWIKDHT